ncbi:MAG: glycosyltransferase [Roseiflexaceae bacterium]|nr:glycosyltransferase [Roseiflexaceae bacterium]
MPRAIDILLLTNDAGSGHRSAAIALEAAFLRMYGSAARVVVRNPIQHTSAPDLLRRYEQVYVGKMQKTPALYHLSYTISELPGVAYLLHQTVRQMLYRAITNLLHEQPYDLVMSVYPIYTSIAARVVRGFPRRPGLMTVVTDLGSVHSVWFNRTDDYCVVPTAVARAKAIRCGLSPDQVITTGLPVHPSFAAPRADTATLRRELGWHPDLPTLLLLGGGAGVGQLGALALALDSVRLPLQVAIVTGTNTALAEQLREHNWRIPAHIYGFVPLADMMHAADIVATKAGGVTVSEALAAGKPLLIHGDPPGQEEGNLRYVQSHGAGLWISDPTALAAHVNNWLAHPAQMERTAAQAQRLGRPDAALRIVRLAWDLATVGPPTNAREIDRRWWRSMA